MRRLVLLSSLALAACAPVTVAPPPAVVEQSLNPAVGGIQIPVTATLARLTTTPTLGNFANIQRGAGRLDALAGAGPLTVFAATDAAFAGLAPGIAAKLLDPENRAVLARLAAYHLVPGRIDTADLRRRLAATGSTTLTTLAGDALTVSTDGPALVLTDANGNRCYIEVADVRVSNGILHTINGVLVPRL